jgi:hypothetical protein
VRSVRGIAVASFVLIACAACAACSRAVSNGDNGGEADAASAPPFVVLPADASLADKAGRVLGTCAGGPESSCHGMSAGGMHLPDEPPNLVDVPSLGRPEMVRVKPFEPDQSYLFLKVLGDGGSDGGRMPLGADPLDPTSTEVLRAWIEAGAPR